jgi:alpha-glucosidase
MIHHDGSALHVPDQEPRLGEDVTVFLRTSPEVTAVHARSSPDGDPVFREAKIDRQVGDEVWWRMEVPLRNPVTRYRFLVEDGTGPYEWYNAGGRFAHEVPDDADFRLVAGAQPASWSNDAAIYEIFPDRFARSAAADGRPTPDWAIPCAWDDPVIDTLPEVTRQFYGGDLDGVAAHLDHIQALGANTVYLTPIFPAPSNHRYNASSFAHIDPLLGGDAALGRLAEALRARGMRLIGDVTTNHTGDLHDWFKDPALRDFYYYDENGDYEAWYGIPSLPKLNWNSAGLRRRMVTDPDSVIRHWLRSPSGAGYFDGWRVDVANMTGRRAADDLTHEVSRLVARTVAEVAPDAMLVGEHNYSAGSDLDVGGWQGAMNYGGFLRPVWTWLRGDDLDFTHFLGVPGNVPRRPATALVAAMGAAMASMSWRSWTHSWNVLGTHDSARIRTITGDRDRVEVAAGLLATLPGTPMIFMGDELGMVGRNGEDARRPMPWQDRSRWDEVTLRRYTDLLRLRREQPALRHGGLRFAYADADAVAFWRETAQQRLLVLARRAAGAPVQVPGVGTGTNLYGGAPLDGALPGDGPTFQVWSCG